MHSSYFSPFPSSGSNAPFRGVRIFCAYTGVAVVFIYFYMLTFTVGCLYLSGVTEEAGRNPFTCKVTPNHNSTADLDGYVLPWSNKFFGTYFANFLNNKYTKFFVIVSYATLFVVAVMGYLRLEHGLDRANLTPDDSYYRDFIARHKRYFSRYGPIVQVCINEPLDYTNQEISRQLRRP